MERDGDKQEVLQQICCGCFFFHIQRASERYSWETTNPLKNIRFIRYFWDLYLWVYVSDSCLSHFFSLLDRRFVFPVQLVTDTAFTCDYKCYSTSSSKKTNLEWLELCKSSVKIGETKIRSTFKITCLPLLQLTYASLEKTQGLKLMTRVTKTLHNNLNSLGETLSITKQEPIAGKVTEIKLHLSTQIFLRGSGEQEIRLLCKTFTTKQSGGQLLASVPWNHIHHCVGRI